jgi:hypothetical protein
MKINTYWALVRTVPGAFIRVTIQADNPYNAFQMLKAMYGSQLISDFASPV